MPLTIVHRHTQLTGVPRYEVFWSELSDFLGLKIGTVDEPALRIFLAAAWMHLFSAEPPLMLWIQGSPPWMAGCFIRAPWGRYIMHSPLRRLIRYTREQTSAAQSLWMISNGETIFDYWQRQRLEFLTQISHGSVELDEFSWQGRVTVIVHCHLPLNPVRSKACVKVWGVAQNAFTVVRFRSLDGDVHRRVRALVEPAKTAAAIGQLVRNLLDIEGRERGFRSAEPEGLFDQIPYLAQIIGACRGSGFDADALAARAIRIGLAHASLMAKPEADQQDLALARKVMFDAIPAQTLQILHAVPLESYWNRRQLWKRTTLTGENQIRKTIDCLVASGAVTQDRSYRPHRKIGDWYSVTPAFQRALIAGL